MLKKFFGALLGKREQRLAATEEKKEELSPFYRPDTRTKEEKEDFKRKHLHPEAQKVASGVCADGQAWGESFFAANKNSDIFNGVTYSCVLDNFCCPECWPLDRVAFPSDQTKRPAVPRHDGCRCLYAPKPKSFRDIGLDMDDIEKPPRVGVLAQMEYTFKNDPSRKLKTPKRTIRKVYKKVRGTAEDWIRIIPEEERRQFFSSDLAYQLWSEGKIKGIDLLDPVTWIRF